MVNKQILVGNIGSEIDLKHTASGVAVANISVATSKTWKNKNTGEREEKTTWHKVVLFSQKAEFAANYLRKGSKVYIEGETDHRQWEDQDGNKRWSAEVIAQTIQNLTPRGAEGGSGGGHSETQDGFRDGPDELDVPF